MGTPWWSYPMKPVRVGLHDVGSHDLGRYFLERKYDGHRAILTVEDGRKRVWTRQRVPIVMPADLAADLERMDIQEGTVLDGEIWNPSRRGGWTAVGAGQSSLTFWDCMRDGMEDVSGRPMEERREAMLRAVAGGGAHVTAAGQERASVELVRRVYEESSAARRESGSRSGFVHGVVLKLAGSPRRDHATRSREHADWLKVVFDDVPGWGS